MGFLDTIKDRLNIGQDDGYYDDDEFDEYYDDEPEVTRVPESSKTGILGNTRRPEAESVSVYTRSGHLVDNNSGSSSAGYGFANNDDAYDSDYRTPRGYEGAMSRAYDSMSRDRAYGDAARGGYEDVYVPSAPAPVATHTQLGSIGGPGAPEMPGAAPRVASGQLPPYVLKPTSYDDVQMVVRRVRTNQPVILSFKSTNIETAKRILDFSLGLTCGINGAVEEIGDRAFAVLPEGVELSDADLDKLEADGTITR